MAVKIMRRGSQGRHVKRWQMFLVGQGHIRVVVDGDFGPQTEKATKAFQRAQELGSDGIVGPLTLAKALTLGFDLGFTDPQRDDAESLLVDELPSIKPITSTAARQKLFGKFEFEPAPTSSNPEKIRILGNWEAQNIKVVTIPQLKGIPVFSENGQRSRGRMQFHRAAEAQLKALWAAWEEAGLLDRILTYDGSFNARFIRGSRTKLSNHALGCPKTPFLAKFFAQFWPRSYHWNAQDCWVWARTRRSKVGKADGCFGRPNHAFGSALISTKSGMGQDTDSSGAKGLFASSPMSTVFSGAGTQRRPDGMHFRLQALS